MFPEVAGVRYVFRKEHKQHPMVLAYMMEGYSCWRGSSCKSCDTSSPGLAYGCKTCGVFIHKSCTGHPDAIESHLHDHPLARDFCTGSGCSCCGSTYSYRSNFYKCFECDFSLDQKCAIVVPVVPDQEPSGSCPSCRSAMSLIEKEEEEENGEEEIFCIMCHERCCFGPIYNCPACKFSFHKLCSGHNRIQHPSHPFHPLAETDEPRLFKCNHCLDNRHTVSYRCEECDFNLDFKCAFLVPRKEFEGKEPILNHMIHEHPLELTEGSNSDCIVCYEPCTLSTYGCRVCLVNVHESCATAKIPDYLHHPLNRARISLKRNLGMFTCISCRKDRSGLYYDGYAGDFEGSHFKIDMMCAYLERPLITFDGHSHPISFHKDFNGKGDCDACGEPCTSSTAFHCPTCDIKLHLSCGPLPCSIKQETHLETLVLKESHVEDWSGYEEIFCDSCEERRDPHECVYYCARCNYSAEIKCVMPELKHVFAGKCGDVELRTLGRYTGSGKVLSKGLLSEEMQRNGIGLKAPMKPNPGCCLEDILQSLTEDEKTEYTEILNGSKKLFEDLSNSSDRTTDPADEEFIQLVQKLDSQRYMDLEWEWPSDTEFVHVGEHLVPAQALHVYNDLYHKYGDVTAETTVSPGQKALFLLPLCHAVLCMCSTKVVDITVKELTRWCVFMKVVRGAGFKIQFAIDALKTVVRAYHGYLLCSSLDEEIRSLEEEIDQNKATLGRVEGEARHHKEYFESGEPSLVKECMREGSLMYTTAGEVVLL